jgi:hypothetical protein
MNNDMQTTIMVVAALLTIMAGLFFLQNFKIEMAKSGLQECTVVTPSINVIKVWQKECSKQ